MPIQLEIFHPDRILIGVARGEVTLEQYQTFLADVVKAGVLHYRKIIDATLAVSSTIGSEQLLALEARLGSLVPNRQRGPIAIVVDPARGDNARVFRELAAKDRPVEVFSSLREARKWLQSLPIQQM